MNGQNLRSSLLRNCEQVFATMLDLKVCELSTSVAPASDETMERVVSLIGFGGSYTGNCMIRCSQHLACKLASRMLLESYETITTDVTDAFGEISNMVFGNVKTELEEHLGPLQLSMPTVIVGKHFDLRSVANSSWVSLPCEVDGEVFEMRMCISSGSGRLAVDELQNEGQ